MSELDLGQLADSMEGLADAGDKGMAEKLREVGEASLNELLRRFQNPEEAKELGSTGLLQLANGWSKIEEKRLSDGAENGPEVSELDLIMDSNLPSDRKIALLKGVLTRLETRHEAACQAIKSLGGDPV